LACTSSPLSMPMNLRIGFLMESEFLHIPFTALEFLIKSCFFFNIYFILSSEILSLTCSTLLEWPSTVSFVSLKALFTYMISIWFFFWDFPDQLLFYILCCLLYFIYLFFYSALCFTFMFVEVISEFIYVSVCSQVFLFVVSLNILSTSCTFWLTMSHSFSMCFSVISSMISSLRDFNGHYWAH
jgi:hypothetical protein